MTQGSSWETYDDGLTLSLVPDWIRDRSVGVRPSRS